MKASTTAKGYGWTHVAERMRRVARYRPGDVCAEAEIEIMTRTLLLPRATAQSTWWRIRRNVADAWQNPRVWTWKRIPPPPPAKTEQHKETQP